MTREETSDKRLGVGRRILPWIVLAVAAGIGVLLVKTPPQVPKSMPSQVAAVVGVAKLEPQSIPTFVEAFGTVVAAREARVQPEVTGRIVGGLPELVPGGLVTAGKTLFEIDKADYEIAVDQAMAELDVARLRIEGLRAGVEVLRKKARQAEAEVDYSKWNMERLGTLSENDQAGEAELKNAQTDYASQRAGLASLQAQIVEQERTVESAIAEAAVAESKLAAARLALSRTSVQAPFDAIVLTESVEVGQLVGPQTVAARLAAVDEFWIEAAVPVARVRDIQYSENGKANGSPVTVTLVTGSNTVNRRGVVLRPLGQLDPQGRMARIVVAVQDPLGLRDGGTGERDAILLGSYVRVSISARTLDGVYAIPRHALRENNRVWVRDRDGTLGIRAVDIVWRRQDDVLVRAEFAEHDELVTTHLASVVPGMPLDIRKENEAKSASAEKSPLSDDS